MNKSPQNTDLVINAQNINKSYSLTSNKQSLAILDNLSLQVATGERVAIVGPSGSGKSTLLSILAGIDTADSGTVQIAGESLENLTDSVRADTIGIVFQNFELVPSFSALENVMLPLDINNIPSRDKAVVSLGSVGLSDRMSHIPSRLSGGEQQRVAVARALVSRPALLLCDEPTGNLDSATGESVMRLILDQVAETDSSLLVITHDMSIARKMDRILELRDGALIEITSSDVHA